MERVESVGREVFVLRTRQLGPTSWCCDLYERFDRDGGAEEFLFEDFGESEIEAIAMALHDAHESSHQRDQYRQ
jgi:hypothetical protein